MKRLTFSLVAAAMAASPLTAQTTFRGQTLNPAETVSGAALTARNSFLGALSASVATNDFESLTLGATAPQILNFGFAGNATLNGSGEVVDFTGNRFPTSGRQYWRQVVGPTNSFSIGFSQAVAGFGFYGTDIGDFNGRLTLQFFSGASMINSFLVQDGDLSGDYREALDGNLLFWGVLYGSNSFDRINFLLEGDEDVFGFDDMTVADARDVVGVPEPGSVALLISGLAGLGVVARRRRA